MADRIHEYLATKHIASTLYLEGCDHPVDLPFYAYLTLNEFSRLITDYPLQAESIKKYSILEDEYILVPYKKPALDPYNIDLLNYLQSKEVCYSSTPIISFDAFAEVFHKRFEQFFQKSILTNNIIIFESAFFQHQLHDIMRMYPIEEDKIIDYLYSLAQVIKNLNPVLFYISQGSIRESLVRTASIRSKPKWALEETIAFMEKRKSIELKAIEKLPIKTYILDNSDYDWDKVFNKIIHNLFDI